MKRALFFSLVLVFIFTAAASPALSDDSGYLVGEGDVLKIAVYDNPDLATTARINSDGTIIFPLVGQIEISGMTVSKVAQKIAQKLANGYIVNPQVSFFIEEFRSKRVVILGQIKNPGLYELSGPTTLLELLSKAGGVTVDAGDNIIIKRAPRGSGAEKKLITINLKKLLEKGDASLDIPIMDGDNVFVAKAGMFYVTGQVNKPDAYKLEDGSSVIKAITMAGGFTNLAAPGKVKIIRKINGKEKILENVSMHDPVLPEDVIVVPESFF
jgi:polysaccharide export outer membrane protein